MKNGQADKSWACFSQIDLFYCWIMNIVVRFRFFKRKVISKKIDIFLKYFKIVNFKGFVTTTGMEEIEVFSNNRHEILNWKHCD